MNNRFHNPITAFLLALAFCASLSPRVSAVGDTLSAYRDLDPDAWYVKSVRYCIEKGVMSGYGNLNRYFEPDVLVNRAELATILWRMDGAPTTGLSLRLDDVEEGIWYEEAVRWVLLNGIMEAETSSAFGTEGAVRREEFITALWHYTDYRNGFVPQIAAPEFEACDDCGMTAPEAVEAMRWATALGIITSARDKDGRERITPLTPVSRSGAAAMLMRFSLDMGIYE